MAKSKELQKTNAMRRVQDSGYPHVLRSYDVADDAIDGLSVAAKLGLPPEQVYKTLVTRGGSGEHYVFVIPVAAELDKRLPPERWAKRRWTWSTSGRYKSSPATCAVAAPPSA